MNESTGEIHGIISREQMHGMWLPHGQRLTVDSEVSDDPTGQELVMMYLSSPVDYQEWVAQEAFGGVAQDVPDYQARVYGFLLDGANPEVKDVLLDSYARELEVEAREIRRIERRGEKYLDIFSVALGNIALEGLVTDEQVDLMRSRLYGPDGRPFMQEAPMTSVRSARLLRLTSTTELPDEAAVYSTNMAFGLIEQAIDLKTGKKFKSHNRSHELLHSVQGLEVHDVTRDDGLRIPIANTVGHFRFPVTTKPEDESDYSNVENTELTEGFIEYLNVRMHETTPELGSHLSDKKNGYAPWKNRVARIHAEHPELFRAIAEASLTEAVPSQPNAKRDSLAVMHEHGETELGKGGIIAYMRAEKQFSDIYDTANRPDAIAANAMS